MPADLTGIKRFILRRYAQNRITLAEIEAIGDKCAEAQMRGESMVEITGSGFDGANSSGVLVMSANELLVAIQDILDGIDPVETNTAPRRVFMRADFSRTMPNGNEFPVLND